MNIITRAQNFDLTAAIDEFTRDQVRGALERFDEDIQAVDVYLKDANGPKGGVDMQALIRVKLRNRQVIALETEKENMYAAIKVGTKRIKRAVRRHLRKAQRIEKQRIREHLTDPGSHLAAG